MNAQAFCDAFQSFQNCTSRKRKEFENFKSITSDHISINARSIIRFFVKNYKRIHLWYVLRRKAFVTFYRDLRARTTPV